MSAADDFNFNDFNTPEEMHRYLETLSPEEREKLAENALRGISDEELQASIEECDGLVDKGVTEAKLALSEDDLHVKVSVIGIVLETRRRLVDETVRRMGL